MNTRKTTIAAMLAASFVATSATAQTRPAEPVKVGIIDTNVERLMLGYKDVAIENRVFVEEGRNPGKWKGMVDHSHGEIVASSFVEQSREIDKRVPISVYMANAFYENGPRNPDGNRSMKLDYKGAERALEWFHENGVRTVVTAFYTNDNPSMRSFIQKAKDLDIVLFAGTNNDKTKTVPFPARDAYAVAVTGTNPNLDFAENPSMAKWTAFKMNGDTPSRSPEETEQNGSSFAVARAAAFGAHYVRMNPGIHRDEVVDVLRQSAGRTLKGKVADLDGGDVMKRFRSITYASIQNRAVKKPEQALASAVAIKGMIKTSGVDR